jgi:hypothetical protein
MASILHACPHSSVQQAQSKSKAMQSNCSCSLNVAIRRCAASGPSGTFLVRPSAPAERCIGSFQSLSASGWRLNRAARTSEMQTSTAEDASSVQELDVTVNERARVEGFRSTLQQQRKLGKPLFTSFKPSCGGALHGSIQMVTSRARRALGTRDYDYLWTKVDYYACMPKLNSFYAFSGSGRGLLGAPVLTSSLIAQAVNKTVDEVPPLLPSYQIVIVFV